MILPSLRLSETEKLRIVVLGYIVRGPLGGMVWHHLQYVMGLARMGHDVFFLEDSGDTPYCYDPVRNVTDRDPTYGLAFAAEMFSFGGVRDRWAYYDAHDATWSGPCASRVPELCRTADLLLNLSGVNPLREWFRNIHCRALVDTDPVFTQIKHLTDPAAREEAGAHTAFFSFGENAATGRSSVPSDGFPWQPTRQPVVLDAWPVTEPPAKAPFTTVMQWSSYAKREHAGVTYGMKAESFMPFLDLPRLVKQPFEVAVFGDEAKRTLQSHGWTVRNPLTLRGAADYREYLATSRGEFTVAKHGYVVARTGWFSERSTGYLASGRPVVTQDTGFGDWLPTGSGLLRFTSLAEAVAAIEEVNARYPEHCEAARSIAEDHFASDSVLRSLLERAMTTVQR